MTENSAAPTIAVRAGKELVRLLLEPKLGSAPKNPKEAETALSWKSYRWMMSTVWLENVIQDQPARWLPAAYANYNELLTAAVEAWRGCASRAGLLEVGGFPPGRNSASNLWQDPVPAALGGTGIA
jgi:hypothetical protein